MQYQQRLACTAGALQPLKAVAELQRAPAGDEPRGQGLRQRLEAVARWLQDVAYADVLDAGLQDGLWVVRRMRVEVTRLPALGERVRLRTWCSAVGQRTAERRTTVEGDRDAAIGQLSRDNLRFK